MALRNIIKAADPVLRQPASKVKAVDKIIRQIAEDMLETMHHAGGIGLAAPQVGISKQIIVADMGEQENIILINPQVVKNEGEEVGVEGCLSVPGVYGEVSRSWRVEVQGENLQGETVHCEAEGLLARALQHEIDHLYGVLFTDKALRTFDPQELEAEG